jgi:hypothetical protein
MGERDDEQLEGEDPWPAILARPCKEGSSRGLQAPALVVLSYWLTSIRSTFHEQLLPPERFLKPRRRLDAASRHAVGRRN